MNAMLRRLALAAMLLPCLAGLARAGAVLDRVKASGMLTCSVLTEPDDYNKFDVHGALDGLGDDICRAVAAAVLGDPGKVKSIDLSSEKRGFAAIQAGKIDLLLGASPSLWSRLAFGVAFGPPVFLDGYGFLVHRDSGIASVRDLDGKQVCFIANTDAEAALISLIERTGLKVLRFPFEEDGEMQAALVVGHCNAMLDSVSRLAVGRAGFHGQVKDFVLLPERLTVEPMAPAFPDSDPAWAAVVTATVDALVLAEAGGIGKANAADLQTTTNPTLRSLFQTIPGIDSKVVDRNWAIRAIGAVGNFGEIYQRDFGPASPLNIPRGPNELWSKGGLVYAPPLR